MEQLRWWLLLLSAVMFSMSGCASRQDWAAWYAHPTHFASGDHLGFSARNEAGSVPLIREDDVDDAQVQAWWGQTVPSTPPADLSGRWEGTWTGAGIFDGSRSSVASATLRQKGHYGVAHVVLADAVGTSVPWAFRRAGASGLRFHVAVNGTEAHLRDPYGEVGLVFRLVGDRLIGIVPERPETVVITLSRRPG